MVGRRLLAHTHARIGLFRFRPIDQVLESIDFLLSPSAYHTRSVGVRRTKFRRMNLSPMVPVRGSAVKAFFRLILRMMDDPAVAACPDDGTAVLSPLACLRQAVGAD